ncbi:hypothetical protein HK104_008522 [Borealophlyctis nickersoniae]|nr:hypothetical protein HK104_008522 [Borealophlyctis nickersoniae]
MADFNPADYKQPGQQEDRGLMQDIQNSFTAEGDHQGTKIAGGVLGVAAIAGLGYVAYDQWLKHNEKEDSAHAKEEFKKHAVSTPPPGAKIVSSLSGDKKDKKDGKDKKEKKDKKDKDGKKDKKKKKEKKGSGSDSSSSSDSD